MKFRKKKSRVEKIFRKFCFKFLESLYKIDEFQNPDEIVWRNWKNAIFKIFLFFGQIISSFIL